MIKFCKSCDHKGMGYLSKLQLSTTFLEEFLSNRAENLYIYSSTGLDGPRASHFSKFSGNFPKFSNPRKSFLKFRSFKFFFLDFNKKNKFYLKWNEKKNYIDFHLRNFPKFSEAGNFFLGNFKKKKCSRTFIMLLRVCKNIFSLIG